MRASLKIFGTVRPIAAESRISKGFAPAGNAGRGSKGFAVQAGAAAANAAAQNAMVTKLSLNMVDPG
jgi:hypothetical protein